MKEPGDEESENHASEEEIEKAMTMPEAPPRHRWSWWRRGAISAVVPLLRVLAIPHSGHVLRHRSANFADSTITKGSQKNMIRSPGRN